jgi:hypothetical protein
MLSFFPSPYHDEILYSTLARYHVRSGNNSPKITLKELFGDSDTIATADLPCNLDALIGQLPIFTQLNVDDVIANNTLYNFYAPFIPPERATQIKESMKSNYGGNIHTRIGLSASNKLRRI